VILEDGDFVAEPRAPYGVTDGFARLRAWTAAMDLAEQVYRLVSGFPASESYGMTSQLRRAAVSVPTNIAEGWGRNSKADFARFIDIAVGSLCEIQSLIALAIRLELTDQQQARAVSDGAKAVGAMLHGLRNKLRST
jgi:four helix bundle protein